MPLVRGESAPIVGSMELEKYAGRTVELTDGRVAHIEGPALRLAREGAIGAPKGDMEKLLDGLLYGKIDGLGKLIHHRDIARIR